MTRLTWGQMVNLAAWALVLIGTLAWLMCAYVPDACQHDWEIYRIMEGR